MPRRASIGLVAGLLLVITAVPARAAAGALDKSFGGDGWTATMVARERDSAATAGGAVVQSNGKVVIGGSVGRGDLDAVLIRYRGDGKLDGTFGRDGVVKPGSGDSSEFRAVEALDNGRLLVAVDSGGNRLLRLDADGRVDASFGGSSGVSSTLPSIDDIAVAPDGSILVLGDSRREIMVERRHPNGALDRTYGDQGVAGLSFTVDVAAEGLAVGREGDAVVTGCWKCYDYPNFHSQILVARFTDAGSPDPDLGGDGSILQSFGYMNSDGVDIALDERGRILVAANVTEEQWDMGVMRLTARGRRDRTFSGDGLRVAGFEGNDYAQAVLVSDSGKVFVVGTTTPAEGGDAFGIARLTEDGRLDRSFGGDGRVSLDRQTGSEQATGAGTDGRGRLVVAGHGGRFFVAARVLTGG